MDICDDIIYVLSILFENKPNHYKVTQLIHIVKIRSNV